MPNLCPLLKKDCAEHRCHWYIEVQGRHPQSGVQVSQWGCAVAWLPVLLIDNTQQQRQAGAAMEGLRNENVTLGNLLQSAMTAAVAESRNARLANADAAGALPNRTIVGA